MFDFAQQTFKTFPQATPRRCRWPAVLTLTLVYVRAVRRDESKTIGASRPNQQHHHFEELDGVMHTNRDNTYLFSPDAGFLTLDFTEQPGTCNGTTSRFCATVFAFAVDANSLTPRVHYHGSSLTASGF
jgi:hypothetical protein